MLPIQKNITTVNYNSSGTHHIEYIVIHFTSNNGDTAYANTVFFKSVNRGASAHYFVDENSIWQCVEDNNTAWHCGGERQSKYGGGFFKICTNRNSIGIEMCSRKKDGSYYFLDGTVENCIELVRALMKKYNIPINKIIRHYDVTGKMCPQPYCFSEKGEAEWRGFKERILNAEEEFTMSQYQEIMDKLSAVSDGMNLLSDRVNKLENPMIYNYIDNNMPEWSRETIQKLKNKGIICGSGDNELCLNDTMLRILTILDRTGAFRNIENNSNTSKAVTNEHF